jgi:hypothetical protein
VKKLSFYSCNQPYDASACSKGCIENNRLKMSFIVNKGDRSVLAVLYGPGNQTPSIFDKCTIFNEKNWDCSYVSSVNGYTETKIMMVNGIFTEFDNYSYQPNLQGVCAK